MAKDEINSPEHYQGFGNIEAIDICAHLNFNRGNIVKYACRAGKKDKDKEIQDLEKIIKYAEFEISRLQGEPISGSQINAQPLEE